MENDLFAMGDYKVDNRSCPLCRTKWTTLSTSTNEIVKVPTISFVIFIRCTLK